MLYWRRESKIIIDPKLESLNINYSADEIAENLDWFNFGIDTRGTSGEKAIKGAFLTAVRNETFNLPRTPKP